MGGCRHAKDIIGEEQPNSWTARLLRLGRWDAETLVGVMTGHTEVNYHRNQTGSAANVAASSVG